jgi:hypothetical protein
VRLDAAAGDGRREEVSMRKPISVAMTTTVIDTTAVDTAIVICDDGAMFRIEMDSKGNGQWHRMPDVPQPADAPRKEYR